MRTLERTVFEKPAYAIMDVRASTMISNILNIHWGGNRRDQRVAPLTNSRVNSLLTHGLHSPAYWSDAALRSARAQVDPDNRSTTVVWDARRALNRMLEVETLAVALLEHRVTQDDWGLCYLRDVAGFNGVRVEYSQTAALGYARPRLKLTLESPLRQQELSGTWAHVSSPESSWARLLGALLMRADNWRLSKDLLPRTAPSRESTNRNLPWLAIAELEEAALGLHAMASIYLVQASVLDAHINRRLYDAAYELAYAFESESRIHLEVERAARDDLLNIPLHPLLQFVAAGLTGGKIRTTVGWKELLYRYGNRKTGDVETRQGPGWIDESCGQREGELVEVLVQSARLASDDGYFKRKQDGQPEFACTDSYAWNFADPDAPEEQQPVAERPLIYTYGELMRMIRGSAGLKERWDDIAGKGLGWGGGGGDAINEINAMDGEFTICDGRSYGKAPVHAVLGFSPCLSLGNVKGVGLDEDVDPRWNTRAIKIQRSVVVVKGHQGATGNSAEYEREFIPAGMFMGEEAVLPMARPRLTTSLAGQQALEHWERRNPQGYVELLYGAATKTDPNNLAEQTDWDAWSVGPVASEVSQSFSIIMGDWIQPFEKVSFYKAVDMPFNFRIVVAMCHNYTYDIFSDHGRYVYTMPWQSFVVFDSSLSLTSGMEYLESIVNVMAAKPKLGASAFDDQTSGLSE